MSNAYEILNENRKLLFELQVTILLSRFKS